MAMSQPDADGVYRNGAAKRKARTDLAMGNLTQLWNEACEAVSFDVPATGIGLGAVGSLARGQVGPSSDLDLVVIYEPHALTDQQLNELANKLWYPIWDSGLDLDQSVRTVAQCEAVTDRDLPAAMGWLDVVPIAGDTGLIESTAVSILERWRKAARKRLSELLGSAKSRLDEFGRMAYINQPDIKEARGGLRDSVLVSALAASWLADRPHGTYDDAVERLLACATAFIWSPAKIRTCCYRPTKPKSRRCSVWPIRRCQTANVRRSRSTICKRCWHASAVRSRSPLIPPRRAPSIR